MMPATKKYKYRTSGPTLIEKVEIESETNAFVTVLRGFSKTARREAKHTHYESYFDTFEEAKAHLLRGAEQRVTSARRALEAANGQLGNIKGMKEQA